MAVFSPCPGLTAADRTGEEPIDLAREEMVASIGRA
jgi:hypothetical protein